MKSWEKSRIFLRGYAIAKDMPLTLKALEWIESYHGDQKRKDGSDYVEHPIRVAGHCVALGWNDDVTVASALLHDVPEDTNKTIGDLYLHFGEPVEKTVFYVTRMPGDCPETHFRDLASVAGRYTSPEIKLVDRCHNVSTMAGVFSPEKIAEYIRETDDYVMPLFRAVRDACPEKRQELYLVKYHLLSVRDSIAALSE
jgi:GTP pyrophosphokinase